MIYNAATRHSILASQGWLGGLAVTLSLLSSVAVATHHILFSLSFSYFKDWSTVNLSRITILFR